MVHLKTKKKRKFNMSQLENIMFNNFVLNLIRICENKLFILKSQLNIHSLCIFTSRYLVSTIYLHLPIFILQTASSQSALYIYIIFILQTASTQSALYIYIFLSLFSRLLALAVIKVFQPFIQVTTYIIIFKLAMSTLSSDRMKAKLFTLLQIKSL